MENEKNYSRMESVYSNKIRAGKRRTYFFDVRKTKGEDYYLTLTESTKRFNGDGYERHKIFLYKEDFNRFMSGLEDAVNHIKTELMPEYDYEEYTRKHKEWEEQRALEEAQGLNNPPETETATSETSAPESKAETSAPKAEETSSQSTPQADIENEDDMSW